MKNTNAGFSLAEVMVAIVIGVISIAAAFSSYNYFNKSYDLVSQKAKINKTAREGLAVITRDLRNAGYIDPNYTKDSRPEIHLIGQRQKYSGTNMDSLNIYYTPAPQIRQRIYYRPWKYQNTNEYFLAREVVNNPIQGGQAFKIIYDNIEFIPHISDFQVVFKDKDGNELVPVCDYCGAVENAQGSGTMVGSYNLGQANMQKVHTAEVYLTLRSPKEIYKTNKKVTIKNHSGSNGNEQTFNDKYHRETFFASVHTRNLAKPIAIAETTGESIGQTSSYNK
ncbi:prepilin-type N-terminal cleavage/methylation domain-containing protein [Pelagibacteraceae bacterium]|jgi:prepilin-type N-terminal cleavage/methylation domain-containing protein|nr:prepilin-type N-terminal cleavage/methylation domain-containing protein [Pelagibacteraceae bacterium]